MTPVFAIIAICAFAYGGIVFEASPTAIQQIAGILLLIGGVIALGFAAILHRMDGVKDAIQEPKQPTTG